jgi:hypothetical protein
MRRINTTNKSPSLFGAGKDGFRNGDMALGVNPTEFDANWCNSLQEELAAIVESVGGALDANNNGQVIAKINALIEARVGDYALDTGTANAKVVALNPAIAAYTGNFSGAFKNAVANTGACTVNFGGGAVPLVSDTGTVLASGDLPAASVVGYQYINADAKAYVTTLVTSQAMSQATADARYAAIGNGKKPGDIFVYSGTTAPAGAMAVPVAATNVSRATYAALFAAIGTTWGVGDGATTFGIPVVPADYAILQASGNVGTNSVGSVISHIHGSSLFRAGSGLIVSTTAGTIHGQGNTDAAGGAANLAAGVRFLLCIQYQ